MGPSSTHPTDHCQNQNNHAQRVAYFVVSCIQAKMSPSHHQRGPISHTVRTPAMTPVDSYFVLFFDFLANEGHHTQPMQEEGKLSTWLEHTIAICGFPSPILHMPKGNNESRSRPALLSKVPLHFPLRSHSKQEPTQSALSSILPSVSPPPSCSSIPSSALQSPASPSLPFLPQ